MECVNIRNEGAVRIVEMDRPEALNAFNDQMMDDLADAFIDATADDSVKVLVLTGAGRAFSAGADLKAMGKKQKPPKHGFSVMLEAIIDFPKPIIIAANGVGAGIGMTIFGLGDMVFLADDARFRCPFSELGLTAEAASTVTFPGLVGHQRAIWMLLSSEWFSAQECVEAGLALEAVPVGELMPHAMAHAQKLAKLPLASLKQTKALVMAPRREQLKATADAETKALAALVGQPANKEALTAFSEKRTPDFTNL